MVHFQAPFLEGTPSRRSSRRTYPFESDAKNRSTLCIGCQNEEVSGRSKPPSVHRSIQLCAIPGRTPSDPSALFWLAPAGIRRFTVSCLSGVQRVTGTLCVLPCLFWLYRIITQGRSFRFCTIAVTLATRTCVRLRARQVGGLSSVTISPPLAALSLSFQSELCEVIMAASTSPFYRNKLPFDS